MSTNKTIVLITGANRGIGYDIAAALLRTAQSAAGTPYHVIMGSRSLDKGQEAVKAALAQAHASGSHSAEAIELDVTSSSTIAAAVASVGAAHGRVDVLVNNAGIVSMAEDGLTRLRDVLETNLVGPYAVTDAFKTLLLTAAPAGSGVDKRLLYVTSDLGSLTLRGDPAYKWYGLPATEYRASKAALNMLALCHKVELADHGVKVFAWSPGLTATGLTGDADIERRRRMGANEPDVVATELVKVFEGQLDDTANGKAIDEHLQVMPW